MSRGIHKYWTPGCACDPPHDENDPCGCPCHERPMEPPCPPPCPMNHRDIKKGSACHECGIAECEYHYWELSGSWGVIVGMSKCKRCGVVSKTSDFGPRVPAPDCPYCGAKAGSEEYESLPCARFRHVITEAK